MGHRCCSKQKVKRGLWSPEEDDRLVKYITTHGHGSWSSVPKLAGLLRCGKSCRLRWINYLRPDLKRGTFTAHEEQIIIDVHRILGNRWAQIAKHLPGRTDNEVKNFWNSCIKKKLMAQGLDPRTHNLIPARLRSHHHLPTHTTIKSHSTQQPFSITTVKEGSAISPPAPVTTYRAPESGPTPSAIYSSPQDPNNCNMLWTGQVFPSSWATVVDPEVHVQSPGYGQLVEGDTLPYGGGPYNYAEEEEANENGGAMRSDIPVEEVGRGGTDGEFLQDEHEMMGIMGTFDCTVAFDMVDPTLMSSTICRDLTSMDVLDMPWNF